MKFYSKCDGCRKKKFFIFRRKYYYEGAGDITSKSELCNTCASGIRKMVESNGNR